ncbi:MAG: hypothetical protein MJ247_00245 [Alphaproteobacteria bacterium]|nr:hypothetical protein [Alphaproteobacteria bacterium]
MKISSLKKMAFIYILSPLLMFVLTHLNWWCSLLSASLILAVAYYQYLYMNIRETEDVFCISKKQCLIILAISIFWVGFSGIGGLLGQSSDYDVRNALYFNLIHNSWPVYYSQKVVMTYYFGFWLIPAFITKILGFFISNDNALFIVGLQILQLYSILGIYIFFCLIFSYIKPKNKKQIALCLLLPIFFSGLDLIGFYMITWGNVKLAYVIYKGQAPDYIILSSLVTHIEHWSYPLQYSSLTTCLFWVFNQTIITWIAVLLFMIDRDPKQYGILFVSTFFCGPFPSVGLGLFMLSLLGCDFVRNVIKKDIKSTILNAWSKQNGLMIPLLILIFLFFSSQHDSDFRQIRQVNPFVWFWFVSLEALLYVALILKRNIKDPIFITMIISLLCICLIMVATDFDFGARASLPAVLVLMLYVLKGLVGKDLYLEVKILLGILLIIGAATPIVEFNRPIAKAIHTKRIINLVPYSLGPRNVSEKADSAFFYRYLAKQPNLKELENKNRKIINPVY